MAGKEDPRRQRAGTRRRAQEGGVVREKGREGRVMWDKKEAGDSAVAAAGSGRLWLRDLPRWSAQAREGARAWQAAACTCAWTASRARKKATASKVSLILISQRLVIGTAAMGVSGLARLSIVEDEWMGADGYGKKARQRSIAPG
ncbi:hypothetical protein DFH09DRAFT_1083649 [Mycena vulgaris]|nr:hypothetical protein DFH09DRAFT_1083649 [Mycena vulgaris]